MTEVRESIISIPTYKLGEPNINPIIVPYRNWKSYPYLMRDSLNDSKESVDYKCLELENEYIKAIVVPEIGGRLFSALDKRSNKEIFYRNNVLKPQLVGLTGAWTSGGIEWNFPRGHRPSTMELVDTAWRKNEDGSASIFIGEIDKISALRFTIELILSPEKAYVEEVVRLYNSTDITREFYLWNTASIEQTPKLEYRYPFKWAIINEQTGKRTLWPFMNGTDLRFDNQINQFAGIFADNVKEDFFGSYDEETETGLVHYANYNEVPGKKLWTWGHKEQGVVWNNILTDDDGPYVEIQSGNVETQEEHRDIEPSKVLTWKEYWFQAYKTGSYTYANKNGTLTAMLKENKSDISVNIKFSANVKLENAKIKLINSDIILYEKNCNLSPDIVEEFEARVDKLDFAKGRLFVSIFDGDICVLRYLIKETKPVLEQIAEQPEIHNAYNYVKYVDDSDFKIALDYIRKIQYEKAEEILIPLWEKNEIDDKISYYLGYVRFKLKKYKNALNTLYYVGANSNYFSAACNVTGKIHLVEKEYEKAELLFEKAYESCKNDSSNAVYYAYALSKSNKIDAAIDVLKISLNEDPVNLVVIYELGRILGTPTQESFSEYNYAPRLSVEDILEILRVYHQIEDFDTSLKVSDEFSSTFSLLSYHKAYYLYILGKKIECQRELEVAEEMSLDYVFPNKDITLEIFESLNAKFMLTKAKYLMGLIYDNFDEHGKCIEIWSQIEDTLKYSVLNRNLGFIYWSYMDNIEKACEVVEKAVDYKPFNADLYYYLNLIYKKQDENDKRHKLLSTIEILPTSHQPIAVTKLSLYLDFKMYEEFFKLIYSYSFRNWEIELPSDIRLRKMYQDARIGKALKDISENSIEKAIDELNKVFVYPPNTGLGDIHGTRKTKVYYYLMLCYESIGKLEVAIDYAKKIIDLNETNSNFPTAEINSGSIEETKANLAYAIENYNCYVKAVNKMVELNWIGIK